MGNDSLVVAVEETVRSGDVSLARSYFATLDSPRSRSTMHEGLQRVAEALFGEGADYAQIPWLKLGFDELALIRQRLIASFPPATVNVTLSAVRGLLSTAFDKGLLSADDLERARRRLKNARGSRISKGKRLSVDEIAHLDVTASMYDEPKATMLRAILAVGIGAGLRRDEICGLPVACMQDRELRVVGKGNKERACALEPETEAILARWFELRGALNWPHRMLFGSLKHRKPLSKITLWRMLAKLGRDAKVDFSPHDLRRTCGSGLLDGGMDLLQVKDFLGHSQVSTTARYDKRSQASLSERRRSIRLFPATAKEDE